MRSECAPGVAAKSFVRSKIPDQDRNLVVLLHSSFRKFGLNPLAFQPKITIVRIPSVAPGVVQTLSDTRL